MARTPLRALRVDDARWGRVTARAVAETKSEAQVVRDALDAYLPPNVGPEPPTRSGPLG